MRLRSARPDDATALLAIMVEGFEGYRSFAAPGWEPEVPPVEAMRERIGAPTTWTLVAEDGDGIVGHVSFLPAEIAGHPDPDPDPSLAHLWQMFVRPPQFGSGLAPRLLARAVEAAREREFASMRLFTPAGQARARRFYEREGWTLVREFWEERLGLQVVEYRRGL